MYNLLIVDDDHLIADGLAQGIDWKRLGFRVIGTAYNGDEAMSFIDHNKPDVILTDIRMPVMDGIELVKRINSINKEIRFVILSGYDDFEYTKEAIKYGVFSYLLKPLKDDEINEVFCNLFLKLENERYQNDQYFRINENFNNNKYLIFGNILIEMINKETFDADTFMKSMNNIGISFAKEYICFVAFCFEFQAYDKDSKMMNDIILHKAIDFWSAYRYPVFINSEYLYIVVNSDSIIDINKLKRDLEYFKLYIKANNSPMFKDGKLSFGIGSTSCLFNNISKSLDNANKALKYRYFKGMDLIIYYNEILGLKNSVPDEEAVMKFIANLSALVTKGPESDMVGIVTCFFNEILYMNYCEKSLLCVRIVEIYLLLINEIKLKGVNIKALKPEEVFHCVSSVDVFEGAIQVFNKMIIELYHQVIAIKDSCNNVLISEIKNYIEKFYYKKLSLQELSGEFYLNPSYLSTLFKKETKENITDYIQKVRIQIAKNLLKELKIPIQEIAEMTGFMDYRYFCSVFKRSTGLSPLNFRMKIIH